MTAPVEILAQALYGSSGMFFPWDSLAPEAHEMFRDQAVALLAQITPLLVAEEREACAKVAESADTQVFKEGWSTAQDAAAISAMMSISIAIRNRRH